MYEDFNIDLLMLLELFHCILTRAFLRSGRLARNLLKSSLT